MDFHDHHLETELHIVEVIAKAHGQTHPEENIEMRSYKKANRYLMASVRFLPAMLGPV